MPVSLLYIAWRCSTSAFDPQSHDLEQLMHSARASGTILYLNAHLLHEEEEWAVWLKLSTFAHNQRGACAVL